MRSELAVVLAREPEDVADDRSPRVDVVQLGDHDRVAARRGRGRGGGAGRPPGRQITGLATGNPSSVNVPVMPAACPRPLTSTSCHFREAVARPQQQRLRRPLPPHHGVVPLGVRVGAEVAEVSDDQPGAVALLRGAVGPARRGLQRDDLASTWSRSRGCSRRRRSASLRDHPDTVPSLADAPRVRPGVPRQRGEARLALPLRVHRTARRCRR